MFAYICWASYLVGVIIRPSKALGSFYKLLFKCRSRIYDKIGKAKASVLPEPVWDAIRKS